MISHDIGRLLPTDEGLNHQIAETFASVGESDLAWTEKVWTSIGRKDGALQIDFGLGKYHNRNVMDGFAGISRGREQWTVRASRELAADPTTAVVGPLQYDVIEPLEKVRFRLNENSVLPLAFDVIFEHRLPTFFEERHRQRDGHSQRVVSDILRYHQPGTVSGWARIDGTTHELHPNDWFALRDHSWGVRLDVGAPPADIRPAAELGQIPFQMHWTPMLFERPDGTRYEIQYYLQAIGEHPYYFSGNVNSADGSQEPVARVRPELAFDDLTRRLQGGKIHLDMVSGHTRTIEIEPISETGFYLGTGLYLGFDGKKHGMWRGPLVVEGERIPDCAAADQRQRIHQLRDCLVRAREGLATGYGIFESVLTGAWPTLGLTTAGSFL